MNHALSKAVKAIWNVFAAIGFVAVFFGLIAFMEAQDTRPQTSNPSGRIYQGKRYLHQPSSGSKKPSKPLDALRVPTNLTPRLRGS